MLLIKELKDKGGEKLIKNCDQVLSYLNKPIINYLKY